MKKTNLIFPLTKQALIYLLERGETHKTYHLPQGLFIVTICFNDVIDKIKSSAPVQAAKKEGWNFIFVKVTPEIIEEVNNAKVGDDILICRCDGGFDISIVNETIMQDIINIKGS